MKEVKGRGREGEKKREKTGHMSERVDGIRKKIINPNFVVLSNNLLCPVQFDPLTQSLELQPIKEKVL